MNITAPSPDKLRAAAGMAAAIDSIRKRLDALSLAPLGEDDLAHLVAVDEWLADLLPERTVAHA